MTCKEVGCIKMAESEQDEMYESLHQSNGENRERTPNMWQPSYETIIAHETTGLYPPELVTPRVAILLVY